jgi:hypothetical protein
VIWSSNISLLHYFSGDAAMLAKLTSKNQLTLPKAVVMSLGKADYYDVEVENGRIMLTPVRIQQADAVREKLATLGIKSTDVSDAIAWARTHKK